MNGSVARPRASCRFMPRDSSPPVVNLAKRVRRGLMGRCDVQVVDSQFISRALGLLVVEAAKAAQTGMDATAITRFIHGLIPSIYMAFYLDNLDQLMRRGLTLDMTNVKGGGVAGFKPLLLIEGGEVVVLQRSRNRGTPMERLIDFLMEFEELDQFDLIHTGLDRDGKELIERLGDQAPGLVMHDHIYGPVLWSYLGPTALGRGGSLQGLGVGQPSISPERPGKNSPVLSQTSRFVKKCVLCHLRLISWNEFFC